MWLVHFFFFCSFWIRAAAHSLLARQMPKHALQERRMTFFYGPAAQIIENRDPHSLNGPLETLGVLDLHLRQAVLPECEKRSDTVVTVVQERNPVGDDMLDEGNPNMRLPVSEI